MVASLPVERQNRRVLDMIFVLVRALALACRGHHELVFENLTGPADATAVEAAETAVSP